METFEIQAAIMTVEAQVTALKPHLDEFAVRFTAGGTLLPIICRNAIAHLETIAEILHTLDDCVSSYAVLSVVGTIENPHRRQGLIAAIATLRPIVMDNSDEKRVLLSEINQLFVELERRWAEMLAEFQAWYVV